LPYPRSTAQRRVIGDGQILTQAPDGHRAQRQGGFDHQIAIAGLAASHEVDNQLAGDHLHFYRDLLDQASRPAVVSGLSIGQQSACPYVACRKSARRLKQQVQLIQPVTPSAWEMLQK